LDYTHKPVSGIYSKAGKTPSPGGEKNNKKRGFGEHTRLILVSIIYLGFWCWWSDPRKTPDRFYRQVAKATNLSMVNDPPVWSV